MPLQTIWPAPAAITTDFKDWRGSPPHLFGKFVGRPWQPWAFNEIYTETRLVIVKEDLFENTPGAVISLKTHNPGQKIAAFTLSQLASQSITYTGTPVNAALNYFMPNVTLGSHSDFITGDRIFYNTWRVRAINRHRDTGALVTTVFAGSGVGPNGLSFTTSSGVIRQVYGNPPQYIMNVEVFVNLPPGNIFADKNFQVEVGFGGPAAALSSASVLTATPEWPAYTQTINTTTV